jgi:hypothetical protein
MPRRELDTSRARCDVCGKPYQLEGVMPPACYALADRFDEDIEDHDVLVSFRHWKCHTPTDVALKNIRKEVDEASKRMQGALDALRSKLR